MIPVAKGAIDVQLRCFIQDTLLTNGGGLTGLVYNSTGLRCFYARDSILPVQINLVNIGITSGHLDGGFVEIAPTGMPGYYRLDLPDIIFATGSETSDVMLSGATNMASIPMRFLLTDPDVDVSQSGINAITSGMFGYNVENGITFNKAVRAISSHSAGLANGGGTTNINFHAIGNSGTIRLTPTVDSSGNRSSVTLNL
jgi:hypothetical protein